MFAAGAAVGLIVQSQTLQQELKQCLEERLEDWEEINALKAMLRGNPR